MIKAIIDFSHYTDGDLGPVAQGIHDTMAANTATYASPFPSLGDILSRVSTFTTALATSMSTPSQAATMAKNNTRATLEAGLTLLGNYVNSTAQGNAGAIAESGFPSFDTVHAPVPAVRAAPQDLRLKQNTLSGSIDVRFTPFMKGDPAELQTTLGDPSLSTGWTHAATFPGSSGTISGFTPGVIVWVRVRSIGPSGTPGAWSDPAMIRVV